MDYKIKIEQNMHDCSMFTMSLTDDDRDVYLWLKSYSMLPHVYRIRATKRKLIKMYRALIDEKDDQ